MDPQMGPRRKGLRVTTGCKTCRQRRVKCDERKPTCRNCAKKNRVCIYGTRAGCDRVSGLDDGPEDTSRHSIRSLEGHVSTPANIFQTDYSDDILNSGEHSRIDGDKSPLAHQDAAVGSVHDTIRENGSPPAQESTPTGLASIFLDSGQITSYYGPVSEHQGPGSPPELGETTQTEAGPGYALPSATSPNVSFVTERISLTADEVSIFRNYVEVVSRWIDSFSRDQPFYSVVPIMAFQCPVLMHSCLALSSKQLALKALGDEGRIRESVAIGYYRKAIKSISSLLTHPEFAQSDEVLASSIILSTYEMFDVVGDSFGSHLKGIAFFLQSQGVTGDASGIKGAAYWTWYRHEIWAALQTGRRMFLSESYWEPAALDSFDKLSVEDIANRVIFLFGQCVSFCNNDRTAQDLNMDENRHVRHHRATALDAALESWKQKLPPSMGHFFAENSPSPDQLYHFPFIWYIYPQSAIANQIYHASKILLTLHAPSIIHDEYCQPGRMQSLSNRRQIERSREQIFLVSNAGVSDTWSLISTECLFVAGLVTEGVLEREQTLKLIKSCQKSSGRRTLCLADELRKLWSQ